MNIKKSICWSVVMVLLLLSLPVQAVEAPKVDTDYTTWFSGVQHY